MSYMGKIPDRGIVAVRAEASGDIKNTIHELNSAFEAFKQTQDERFQDVVTEEKLENINASIATLQSSVDDYNAKIEAAKLNGGGSQFQNPEYTAAFQAHMKTGSDLEIKAAMSVGTDADGGYLAPVEWDRTITDKLVEISPMRQIASVQNISGTSYKKLFNLRGTGSGWVGEATARTETASSTLDEMTIDTGEIYANPKATQQILDDAEVDLEAWIANEVQTEFADQEAKAFIDGNGTNKPRGFLGYITGGSSAGKNPLGNIDTKTTASATAVTEDELINLIYAIPSAYTAGARFVCNRNTIAKIRKLRDSDGRQLWQPSSQAGQPSVVCGYPITEMQGMPDIAANAKAIAFGDFKRGYLIVDRIGVRVLRDPYSAKPHILFYTTKRVGGAVVNTECLKILKQKAS